MKNLLAPQRILLVRTDRIGDVVLTTPAAGIIRQAFPEASIFFLSREYTRPLLQMQAAVNKVLVYRPEGIHRGWRGVRRLSRELLALKLDTAILFYPRPALAAALCLAGIPRRIGIGYRWYSFLMNQRIYEHRKHGLKHELEYNLNLLTPLLDPARYSIRFDFSLPADLLQWRNKFLAEQRIAGNYIVLHPGNGGSAPNLTLRQYRLIINHLLKETDFTILLSGSIAERHLCREIRRGLEQPRLVDLSGQLSLQQLCGVLAGASLFLSTSTGPLHIANAFGIPVLGFYCPARSCAPQRWGAYDQLEWMLVPEVQPCQRCKIDRCPNGNCLEKLERAMIITALRRRLEQLTPPRFHASP